MTEEQIVARQHYVPRFILRGFADGKLLRAQLMDDGSTLMASLTDLAVEKHFYADSSGDRQGGQEIEAWLNGLEGDVSPVVHEIVKDGGWPLGGDARFLLCTFAAVQWSRTPTVKLITSHLARQLGQGTLESELGFEEFARIVGLVAPGDPSIEARWETFRDVPMSAFVSDNVNWASRLEHARTEGARHLFNRAMGLLVLDQGGLITSDRGIGTWSLPNEAGEMLGGLHVAQMVVLPLSRRHAVIWDEPSSREHMGDWRVYPNARTRRETNGIVAAWADRWIYYHPEDHPFESVDGLRRVDPISQSLTETVENETSSAELRGI